VLKSIFGPKREKWWEAAEDFVMMSSVTFMLHQILLVDQIKEDEVGRTWDKCM
jgi:hypothetical protein